MVKFLMNLFKVTISLARRETSIFLIIVSVIVNPGTSDSEVKCNHSYLSHNNHLGTTLKPLRVSSGHKTSVVKMTSIEVPSWYVHLNLLF